MSRTRVKVISKESHPEHYGHVGTLVSIKDGYLCCIEFDDKSYGWFRRGELRLGVKKYG